MDLKLIEIMKELGFSEYESKVYVALVSVGGGTATEIAKISQVPTNRVYQILSDLSTKGYVRAQTSLSSPNYYFAESPKTVMNKLEEKFVGAITEARNTLEALYERAKRSTLPIIWTLRGDKAIYEKIISMIKSAEKELFLIIDTLFDFEEYQLIPILQQAHDNGIDIRIITADTGIDDPGEIKVLKALKGITTIKIQTGLESIMCVNDQYQFLIGGFGIIGDHERDFVALWSETRGLNEMGRQLFLSTWETLTEVTIE